MAKNLKLNWLRGQTNWAGVVLSLLCLPALFGDDFIAIAQQKTSQYGLGIKLQQTGSSHAPQIYCITAIAPKDGGRTLSHQPNLYFYLGKNKNEAWQNIFISELRIRMKLDGFFLSKSVLRFTRLSSFASDYLSNNTISLRNKLNNQPCKTRNFRKS